VWLAVGLVMTPVLLLQAQKGYGPNRLWWDAGADAVLPWDEGYANPSAEVGVRNTVGRLFFAPWGEERARLCDVSSAVECDGVVGGDGAAALG
jgi:hypothetical protein